MESSNEASDDERGDTYEGERNKHGERHGLGRASFPNGDTYHGNYYRGKRCGHGTYTFAFGGRYEGSYIEGCREGYGEIDHPDGSRYEGQWANNLKCGHGIYFYLNRDRYEGDWLANKRHGQGKYFYNYGPIYDGQWKHGAWHGSGKFINTDHSYIGTYHKGLPVGKGKFVFNNGYEQHGYYVIKNIREETNTSDIDEVLGYKETRKFSAIWRPTKIVSVYKQYGV